MLIGQLIAGRYRLEEEVGAGGMGVVWRATDVELDRVVAVKRAHAGGDRSLREAKAAASLHHPNVVTLFDVVSDGGDRWLVMEYLPSHSLADIVGQPGGPGRPLPAARVAVVGAQLASALQAVHAIGTLHRDVKPGNVLVAPDGTAKLCDFGISRTDWGDPTLTGAGILGTPAYLAPEVASGQSPTAASDVFALGATLFYAVEGSSPYGVQDNPAELIRKAARGQVLAPRQAGPLAPVLAAMLQRDPRRRPEAGRVAELFGAIAADERLASAPTEPRTPRVIGSRRRATTIAAAAAGVVLIAAAVFFAVRDSGGEPVRQQAEPAAGAAGMGDPKTADPCALLDPQSLKQFGDGELNSVYGNFDRCDVNLTQGSLETDVVAELDNGRVDQAAAGPVQQTGPLTVKKMVGKTDECDREIGLPDNTKVIIFAQKLDSDTPDGAPFCAIADAATEHAVTVLRAGPVPRRQQPFPADSLANKDACTLLSGAALGANLPGVNADSPQPSFGNWECTWYSTTSHADVVVSYDHDQPLSAADGTPVTLAGRRGFVLQPEPGDDSCEVEVLNRTTTDADGKALWELLSVEFNGDGQPIQQMCGAATALAGAAAANLPGRPG